MVSRFNLFVPLVMGQGAAMEVGPECKKRGITKVGLVSDKGLEGVGIVDQLKENLEDNGIDIVYYNGVRPDPTDVSIEAGAEMMHEAGGVQAIIGLGGGSALDTAKGINVLMGNPLPLADYYVGGKKSTEDGLLLLLVPTTAGTGSEVTYSSVITDTRNNNRKASIRSSNCCLADIAFVDPLCSKDMPPRLTANTGMDAFAHSAESLTVNQPNPLSDVLAKEAVRLVYKYLPVVLKDGSDLHARERMALAATFSGMAFANTLVHIGHSIGHSLGARLGVVHGHSVGLAQSNAIYFAGQYVPERVRVIGDAMGLDIPADASDEQASRITAEAIEQFRVDIGLPSLKEEGFTREEVVAIDDQVVIDGTFNFVPGPISQAQIKEMLGYLYDGKLYPWLD